MRQVLPIAGAVVGSFFGAPQLGFAIGSLIGNAVAPLEIEGSKVGDNPMQTASEGGARAIVFGTGCVRATCLLERGNRHVQKVKERGGKGGPVTVNERVYWTFAVGLGEAIPGGAIIRIWEGEKLVYDASPDSAIPAETTEFAKKFRFYDGSEDQLPDPALEAIHGIGNAHYYRGTAYVVFPNYDLTDYREQIPVYRWEVASAVDVEPIIGSSVVASRNFDSDPACAQAYIWNDELRFLEGQPLTPIGGTYRVRTVDQALQDVSTAAVTWKGGGPFEGVMTPVAADGAGHLFYKGPTNNYPARMALNGVHTGYYLPTDAPSPNWWGFESGSLQAMSGHVWFGDSSGGAGSLYMAVRSSSGGGSYERRLLRFTASPSGETSQIALVTGVGGVDQPFLWMTRSRDGNIWVLGTDDKLRRYDATLTLQEAIDVPGGVGDGLIGIGVDDNVIAFVRHVAGARRVEFRLINTWEHIRTVSGIDASSNYPVRVLFTDQSCFVQIGAWVGRIPYQVARASPEKIALSQILTSLHLRAGHEFSDFDVADCVELVAGVVFESTVTFAESINSLIGSYFKDASEYDKSIHYISRGKPVVRTLTEDDLTDEPESSRRENAIEYPRKLHYFFQSPITHYAATKATSARSSPDVHVIGEASVSSPITYNDPDEPAQVSAKLHKVYWADAEGEIVWHVSDEHADLVPADCVGLSLRGVVRRARVTSIEDDPGVRKLTMRIDRQSAYTSNVTGIPLPPATPPRPSIIAPSVGLTLDIPALTDDSDDLHYLRAISGMTDVWAGAVDQRSLDGGASFSSINTVGQGAVIGLLQSSVTPASPHFTDTTNRIVVDLFADDEIESISQQQFLSEGGAFALSYTEAGVRKWELCQYRDAEQDEDGNWVLSMLHRGRLNTDAAGHEVGEYFVLLDEAVLRNAAQSAWLGQELVHRAVSNGLSPETASTETTTYTGQSQREFPLAHVGLALGGDNLTVHVVPRHRFGTDDNPLRSINWTGYRIAATDGANSATYDTTADLTEIDVSGWSGPITVAVAQVNRITGPGPTVTESTAA